jgi:hypothetical protein
MMLGGGAGGCPSVLGSFDRIRHVTKTALAVRAITNGTPA